MEDTTVNTPKQAILEGISTEVSNPTSEGNSLMVVHIGNEKGFLPGSQVIFENDHETMVAGPFENWFRNVLSKLEPNAVIVMDNECYHSSRQERLPVTTWRKQDIQEWLSSKEISFENNELKAELLVKVHNVKNQYQLYVTGEMAKQAGIKVLRLPPYNSELNPNELVWADVKGYVARNNTTFKIADVKKLLEDGFSKIDVTKWKNCVDHIIKEENKLNGLDYAMDKTVDSFIINGTDSSTFSSLDNDSGTDTDELGMSPM